MFTYSKRKAKFNLVQISDGISKQKRSFEHFL